MKAVLLALLARYLIVGIASYRQGKFPWPGDMLGITVLYAVLAGVAEVNSDTATLAGAMAWALVLAALISNQHPLLGPVQQQNTPKGKAA